MNKNPVFGKQSLPEASDEEWSQALLLNDEWANYFTHGFAFILSLVGFFFIIRVPQDPEVDLKSFIFGAYACTLALMYGASTFYHYAQNPLLKKKLRILDHCAIYLFIAGSYTPFTLILMKDAGGLFLFSLIWSMTAIGIFFKIFFINRFKILSVAFYLTMGWLVMFSIQTFIEKLPLNGLYLLIAGGLFYTIGVVFYLMDKRRFFHAIWHLFTFSGSACHYFCIFFYL